MSHVEGIKLQDFEVIWCDRKVEAMSHVEGVKLRDLVEHFDYHVIRYYKNNNKTKIKIKNNNQQK